MRFGLSSSMSAYSVSACLPFLKLQITVFKYAITGIQFDNEKNYQKLKHDVGNKTK